MICPATPTGSLSVRRHRVVGDGVDVAEDFGGQAAVVFEAGGGVGDVVFGFDDGLAGVAAFEFGERGQSSARIFSARRKRTRPRSWAVVLDHGPSSKAAWRGGDGAVDFFGAGVGDLGDDFFGGGIVDGEGFRGMARGPFAVDKHLVSFYFCSDSARHFVISCLPHGLKATKLLVSQWHD